MKGETLQKMHRKKKCVRHYQLFFFLSEQLSAEKSDTSIETSVEGMSKWLNDDLLGRADLILRKTKSPIKWISAKLVPTLLILYKLLSLRHVSNNRKHKGPADKPNESSPEEPYRSISFMVCPSFLSSNVFI